LSERREVAQLKLVRGALVFSHDGNTLAVASGHTIKLFDTARWQEKATLEGHANDVRNLAFSPDDQKVASSSSPDGCFGVVKVWDVSSGRARYSVRGIGLAFSPDGRLLATTWGHPNTTPAQLMLVDVASGRERLTLSSGHLGPSHTVAFSPDGTLVAGMGQIWDVQTGKLLRTCLGGGSFHPDGKTMASANGDGSISLWDLATGQERMVLTGHAGGANSVAFSPDGATLASAGEDRLVKLWHGPAGQEARALRADPDPLAIPPLIGDLNQQAQQLEQVRKALEQHPDLSRETRGRLARKYWDLGRSFAEAKRYPEATQAYGKVIELDPENPFFRYLHALALLSSGDLLGYRAACAEMVKRWDRTERPDVAHWVAWTTVLAPDAVKDLDQPVHLAESASRSDPKSLQYSTTLGAAEYRAGRFAEAVKQLNQAIVPSAQAGTGPTSSTAYTWFFLAMSYQRLGQFQDARESLDKGRKQMEQETQDPDIPWNRRLTLQLLRKEAETLLGATRDEKTAAKDSKDAR
jgi:tetratricopeptide (TPR) repeat protein